MSGAWPRYLNCTKCGSQYRMELLGHPTTPGSVNYCPCCGAQTPHKFDKDQDYWYVMAGSLLNAPTERGVELIRGLYDLWTPGAPTHFATFVHDTMKEYANNG